MARDCKESISHEYICLPQALYTTDLGKTYVGDAVSLCESLPDESVDLVLTSPPFALQRKKAYGAGILLV